MLEGTTVVRGDPLHRRPAQLVGRQALEGQAGRGEGVPAAQRLRPARQTLQVSKLAKLDKCCKMSTSENQISRKSRL